MDNIIVVLISSVLASALTLGTSLFLQRDTYKNDYYKKVIEYRIKAYEQVSELLDMFPFRHELQWVEYESVDKVGVENFHKILRALGVLVNNGYWLTKEMREVIGKFYQDVASFYDEFNGLPNEEVEKMANYGEEIKAFKSEALLIFYRDIDRLHDVKCFLKDKKN